MLIKMHNKKLLKFIFIFNLLYIIYIYYFMISIHKIIYFIVKYIIILILINIFVFKIRILQLQNENNFNNIFISSR